MSSTLASVLELVSSYIGHRISKVERVLYEFEGRLEEDDGEVQIHCNDMVLRLRCSPAGELVEVVQTPWQDPFEGPLTRENIEFIRSHGRWHLVDVSERLNYRNVVGKPLTNVLPLTNRFGRMIGVQLQVNGTVMNVFVHADELHVSWGSESIPRWGHEWVDEQ